MVPSRIIALVLASIFQSIKTRLGQSSASPRSQPSSPEGLRIYAIGDIHGRADLLRTLLGLIVADAEGASAGRKLLIYLGDYVDRGGGSREVLELLLAGPPPGFEARYLKGNHEEALLHFLQEPDFGREWRHYGGLETLASYGVTGLGARLGDEGFEQARDQFEALLPESHRAFFEGLEISVGLGDYFFVHAGVRPGVALEDQREEDLLWIRDEFTRWSGSFGKVVVHGHSISERPEHEPNRINVDTGAYMTNQLTCVVLDGVEQRFLQTGGLEAPREING